MAPIQPSASVAATGLGIRYVGNNPTHAYAYSGPVANINQSIDPTTPCLDFTSGAGYIVGTLGWLWHSDASSADTKLSIKFNGNEILSCQYGGAGDANDDQPFTLIIPPLTHVEVLWGLENADSFASFVFAGRVYGAE